MRELETVELKAGQILMQDEINDGGEKHGLLKVLGRITTKGWTKGLYDDGKIGIHSLRSFIRLEKDQLAISLLLL